ncbi:hypothetical protein Srubr_08950 [Streptomyces rubradiris]|uniref:Uncharacterized protein n=1 Tax=Streptomyces rubradiris TaxID=285531 RepID=A0ABQ3R5C7_STRRR|nr:hypothetical protein GCM10018792_68210 [Streptomyces rubradiris]GHI51049.1 hypothetical protein Srubr_08950 [Streptomyces rubradiris]
MGSKGRGIRTGRLPEPARTGVRALLDAASARDLRPDRRRAVQVGGRPLPEAVTARAAEDAGPSDS